MLGGGAPLGLLLIRRFGRNAGVSVQQDVRRDLPTYLYVALATPLVFALFGRVLGRQVDRLAELSAIDALTGLLNSRAFYPRLAHEIERSRRSGAPMSLLMLDLDQLKTLNDRHGHAAGDRALEQLARAIQKEMRATDAGARL
jgi:PleD family two-component response regulator